jgi:hydroxymethylpyrimidine pyrophosphatase-like HAD family hydrolase
MIMHKEARKSIGISKVASEFNICKNEILVFGDDTNDKDMFLNSGLSVAMSNAIDDIKALADHICDTNDNDGVAKWLDENIL